MSAEAARASLLARLAPVWLTGALGASAMLSAQHLSGARLPGCALDSPCRAALTGPFGAVPWIDWPVAFLGASFFAALLAARLVSGPAGSRRLFLVTRVGALVSLGFLLVAFQQGTPCPYCIAANACNLVFWLTWERSRPTGSAPRAERTFAGVLLGTTLVLAGARGVLDARDEAAAERELSESTRAIVSGESARPFTGRYLRGPERAPMRLVLFTDYQCPDCKRIENEAWEEVEARADLSLSIKHFPLCRDCNRRARELDHGPHPNACWAARAAEAVGRVHGNDAFWRFHRWLFARGGGFTADELRAGLAGLGLDPARVVPVMHAADTLALVEADVEEALSLGIQGTPMVFLNGVELRGWRAPGAVARAVEALAATAPTAAGPEADRPQGALEKALEDWRLAPRLQLPRRVGEDEAEPDVVVWGDYLDETTRELDRRLRALLAERPELTLSFRHYPLDRACTPSVPDKHPGACLAARAVEAARRVGGAAGRDALHERMMALRAAPDEQGLQEDARAAGLDVAAFGVALRDPTTTVTVRTDVAHATSLGAHAVPFLVVAGRHVARWRLDGEELLEALLDEAFPR